MRQCSDSSAKPSRKKYHQMQTQPINHGKKIQFLFEIMEEYFTEEDTFSNRRFYCIFRLPVTFENGWILFIR